MTYTKQEQRQLDQASGDDLDRRASKFKCATCGDKGWVFGGQPKLGVAGHTTVMSKITCPACGGKPAYSDYLNRPTRSKEAVALDLAVDALATARTALSLVSANPIHTYTHTAKLAIEKIDRVLFGIAELRK